MINDNFQKTKCVSGKFPGVINIPINSKWVFHFEYSALEFQHEKMLKYN